MIVFELTMPHSGAWNGKWSQADRLEIMGLLNTEERKFGKVVGHLTAENVFQRIERDWKRRAKND